jgi:hypothetical protein
VAGQRLLETPLPLVDDAEVVQARALTEAVAQRSADGQALPGVAHRLRVATLRVTGKAKIGLGLGLGGPVAELAGDRQSGLVDLHPVLPVAADAEHPE